MFGCGAHILNLLAKDLAKDVVDKVINVVKCTRNHHLPMLGFVRVCCNIMLFFSSLLGIKVSSKKSKNPDF